MAKNLVSKVCRMLGVEVGERFKIKNKGDLGIYKFNKDGDVLYYRGSDNWSISLQKNLTDFLNGKYEIVKYWKPEKGEPYFTFYISRNFIYIEVAVWEDSIIDFTRYRAKLVFNNIVNARKAIPSFARDFNLAYEEWDGED